MTPRMDMAAALSCEAPLPTHMCTLRCLERFTSLMCRIR